MNKDEILPVTRWVAGTVVLALATAFTVLFFMPDRTGELFAWPIQPNLSSMFLGAAYLGGAWILFQTAVGKYWHRVQAVFPAVVIFTSFMLVATMLHWDRFTHGSLAFILWVFLYVVSPFLILALWITNRRTDTHEPEPSDAVVSATARRIVRIIGAGVLIAITAGFLYPTPVINLWPWALTPLTARVICGWLSVIGVSAWVLSSETRWTAWRSIIEGISLAVLLIIVACLIRTEELMPGLFNWFMGVLLIFLIGLPAFYLKMERERKESD